MKKSTSVSPFAIGLLSMAMSMPSDAAEDGMPAQGTGLLDGMLGTLLIIALLVLLAIIAMRLFRRDGGSGAPAKYVSDFKPAKPRKRSRTKHRSRPLARQPGADTLVPPWSIPGDFDVPGFLHNAKASFVRLQSAWDRADIDEIHEFATAEICAELALQLQQRGIAPNVTEVVTVGAELLHVETADEKCRASVKFTGMIKESENAPVEPFIEVWNLFKPMDESGGWTLSAIRQL